MITTAQMYWLTRLDAIHNGAMAVMIISLVVVGLLFSFAVAMTMADIEDGRKVSLTRFKTIACYALCALTSVVLYALTPTTREMAAIIVVPKIVNSEKIQDVGNKLYDLAVEWMEELSPRKKEGEAK